MKSIFIIFLMLLMTSCAQRGYQELVVDVPDFHPTFKAESYKSIDTDDKHIFYSKKLSAKSDEEIKKIDLESYKYVHNEGDYPYYSPVNRQVSSDQSFAEFERIETTITAGSALLIE